MAIQLAVGVATEPREPHARGTIPVLAGLPYDQADSGGLLDRRGHLDCALLVGREGHGSLACDPARHRDLVVVRVQDLRRLVQRAAAPAAVGADPPARVDRQVGARQRGDVLACVIVGPGGAELWRKLDGDPPVDETECTFLALDTASPYDDNRPPLIPGQAEWREYRARYWDGTPVGDWSAVIRANFGA